MTRHFSPPPPGGRTYPRSAILRVPAPPDHQVSARVAEPEHRTPPGATFESETRFLAGCLGVAGETDPVKLERVAAVLADRGLHWRDGNGELVREAFERIFGRPPEAE